MAYALPRFQGMRGPVRFARPPRPSDFRGTPISEKCVASVSERANETSFVAARACSALPVWLEWHAPSKLLLQFGWPARYFLALFRVCVCTVWTSLQCVHGILNDDTVVVT